MAYGNKENFSSFFSQIKLIEEAKTTVKEVRRGSDRNFS